MDIRTTYSNYLKSADLGGHEPTVTIASCEMEEMPGSDNESKPVLKFHGKEKGIVLNVTNRRVLEEAYGPMTENWVNRQVQLYVIQVRNPQGNMVDGLRVRIPAAAPAPAPVPEPAPAAPAAPVDDDTIPF